MIQNLTAQQINPMLIPGLEFRLKSKEDSKKRLTEAIAKAWDIPEDKVLGCTLVIDKVHPSSRSANGERIKIPGERHVDYVNARKFYFYVMIELKKYSWKALTKITGRKIAAMEYANKKAQEHMAQEKGYLMRAQLVLDDIDKDLIIFPTPTIIYEANAQVINRTGVNGNTPTLQLPESSK